MRLVGIDTASIDPADSKTLASHQVIRRRGLRVLENLVLDDVPEGDYELIALPLKLIDRRRLARCAPCCENSDPMTTRRDDALALDAADPLAPLREQFALPDGRDLPRRQLARRAAARPRRRACSRWCTQEWGAGLIRSWNSAGWIDLPQRVGDKIARLVGAGAGRAGGRRLDLGEPVQGAERGAGDRARRRAAAHA